MVVRSIRHQKMDRKDFDLNGDILLDSVDHFAAGFSSLKNGTEMPRVLSLVSMEGLLVYCRRSRKFQFFSCSAPLLDAN